MATGSASKAVKDEWVDVRPSSDGDWVDVSPETAQSPYLQRQNALIDKMLADKNKGALSSIGEDIKGLLPLSLKSAIQQPLNVVLPGSYSTYSLLKSYLDDAQRKKQGYGLLYRALAPIGAAATGTNLRGMEEAAGRGDTGGVLGHTAVPTTMAIAPLIHEAVLKPIGSGIRHGAEGVAESSLGVTNRGRAYGRTPGAAILDETRGLKPSTVLTFTKQRLTKIGGDLETAYRDAGQKGKTVSLQPAMDVLDRHIAEANAAHRPDLARAFQQSKTRLMTDQATKFKQVNYTPEQLWKIKTGHGELINWSKLGLDPKLASRVNKEVYGAIDRELDSVAPEVKALNQRYSSLKTVQDRASIMSNAESLPQGVINRWTRRTGGALAGLYELSRGNIPAALALTLGPEALANPAVQMAIARTLNAASGAKKIK
jgi:hypothetical protein